MTVINYSPNKIQFIELFNVASLWVLHLEDG